MEVIRLGNDGRLRDAGDNVVTDALSCLSNNASLDAGFTLRGYFALFGVHPDLARISPFIGPALRETEECAGRGCVTEAFDRLELGRTVELVGFPGEARVEVYHTLRGVSGESQGSTGQRCEHDIRFVPLGCLLDMPLFLGRARHVLFGEAARVLECSTTFRLFDIIEGIAWELGFQGGSGQCSLGR